MRLHLLFFDQSYATQDHLNIESHYPVAHRVSDRADMSLFFVRGSIPSDTSKNALALTCPGSVEALR